MADAKQSENVTVKELVKEATSEVKDEETVEEEISKPDARSLQEEFDSVLENAVSKLWDERGRNKSKGRRKRLSKDEERTLIGQLLEALNGSTSETESLQVIAKRLVELVVENKTSEYKVDELSRKCSLLIKDKEDLNGQYKKSKLALAKLESLCRELQKHNRLMKEECDHRTKVEEAKRQELSVKFQSSIGEITSQMQDNHSKNQQLKTDNAELAAKLKGLVDQYEMREQYVDKVLKHKQIENQLLEAKLAQQTLMLNEEKEQALKEKQQLLQESLEYQKKCEQLVKDEAELKLQLSMYTEKFEEFQKTLTKSNEVFGTFKKEMDKMTKTIKKLEKETVMWKQKWEKSNQSLLELAGDNTRKTEQIKKITQKNSKLENLCRALQIERKELSRKLEGNQCSLENANSCFGDSKLKPESEQLPSENLENSTSIVPAESECYVPDSSREPESSDYSEAERSIKGLGDECTEASQDEELTNPATKESAKEKECCEDDKPEDDKQGEESDASSEQSDQIVKENAQNLEEREQSEDNVKQSFDTQEEDENIQ